MKIIDFEKHSYKTVHHEYESCESGRYVSSGESHMYEITYTYLKLFSIKIPISIKRESKNLGLYHSPYRTAESGEYYENSPYKL